MKHLFYSLSLFFSLQVLAQPVINSNVIAPIGSVTAYYKSANATANTFNAGASGANATWNFASLDTAQGSFTQSVVIADTTYYYNEYPSVVNYAVGGWAGFGPTYVYAYLDNSKFEYYGVRSISESKIFQDPQKQLTFPFTYNNQFSDTFYDEYPVYYGNVTVKADGYGTLTTPAGTFANALRIKYHEVYRQYDMDTPDDSLFYEGTYYRWYQPNTPNLLLEYSKLVSFYIYQGQRYDFDSLKHVVFTKNVATAINEPETFKATVYPNPAGNTLMINAETVIETAEITDLYGRVVLQQNGFAPSLMLNIEALPAGAYNLQLTTADNRRKTVKVLHY